MTRLIIVGAGGFGFEVAMICDAMLAAGVSEFDSYSFIDDDRDYAEAHGFGDHLEGRIEGHRAQPDALYVCSVHNPLTRRYVCAKLDESGAHFCNIVHPAAEISKYARIGRGVVVGANAFVSCFTTVGDHVHINTMSSISHDSTLGNFATLGAHVDITAGVEVEEGAFFGTHSAVTHGHRIGAWSRIGAGCVIQRPIAREAIVYSEPPKFLSRGGEA